MLLGNTTVLLLTVLVPPVTSQALVLLAAFINPFLNSDSNSGDTLKSLAPPVTEISRLGLGRPHLEGEGVIQLEN